MRLLLLFVFLSGFTLSYQSYQSSNTISPQASYHPLYEQRRNRLLGIYGMNNRVNSDATLSIAGNPQDHSLSEKLSGIGLTTGYLLNPNHRILLNFESFFKKNGFSYQTFALNYAFTPQIPNTINWRLLLSANAGIAFAQFNEGSFVINDSAMGKLKYTGFTYGAKTGVIYQIPYGELELGIQTRRLNFGSESSSVFINNAPAATALDLSQTSSTGLFLGYNFLF
ncbi:DUF1934 domain-containing protein [Helicobacter mesocricetorum]|uniref:DUF1934 domain-containing protein n=1 Tax=Helicobacter mesocricetorum TaxID=87012 RepID=UPI000CF1B8E1|nr:DUF1934 domain-containing protein [Helicobacter mesocricetorum]